MHSVFCLEQSPLLCRQPFNPRGHDKCQAGSHWQTPSQHCDFSLFSLFPAFPSSDGLNKDLFFLLPQQRPGMPHQQQFLPQNDGGNDEETSSSTQEADEQIKQQLAAGEEDVVIGQNPLLFRFFFSFFLFIPPK